MKINRRNKLCECGCGQRVKKKENRYIHNHHTKGTAKPKSPPQPCECGCGEMANPGKKYIFGHNRKGKPGKKKPKPEPKLCECGCGEYANYGKRFISGHNSKNNNCPSKKPGVGEKISKSLTGHIPSKETREKWHIQRLGNNNSLGCIHNEESKEKQKNSMTGKKASPETIALFKDGRRAGENNPRWQGGKSFEIYPQEVKII